METNQTDQREDKTSDDRWTKKKKKNFLESGASGIEAGGKEERKEGMRKRKFWDLGNR